MRWYMLIFLFVCEASDYQQSTTDYSSHVAHVRNFVQDERSAEIDYSSCVWTKTFAIGSMDCETFLDNSVMVGMECTKTNCNTKRLRCCAVRGRFKNCNAIYNGFVNLVNDTMDEMWDGLIGSKNFGSKAVSLVGRHQDLKHHFMVGMQCAGKNCRTITLRVRKLYCDLEYIIENELDELKGHQRSCKWTKWFTNNKRPPIPPPKPGESKSGTSMLCPKNTVASGLDCKGATCDHLRIFCCHLGHVCPIGTYGNNERCALCPKGRYGQTPGLLTPFCTANCPKGRYGPNIGTSKPKCGTSYSQASGGSPEPSSQPVNPLYNPAGQVDCCVDCPAGRYNDAVAQDDFWDCKLCPVGRYGPSDGITASVCPSGSNVDCCIDCAMGRFREKPGGIIPADCTYCPPGTYGQTTGLYTDMCTAYCPLGRYNSKAGQTSIFACIKCPDTFTGSKAKWGEQCIHRMPTRIIWEFGEEDNCGPDDTTLHVEGDNKCMKDTLDYGKSHPRENSHNQADDTAYYVTRMGYPRFCDTKTMCLRTGPFLKISTFVQGQSFPIGEAGNGGGTLTPWLVEKGTQKLGYQME